MSEADAATRAAADGGAANLRPGRVLAEARAARNLTVAEAAQQLKLSVTQVEALEADAYDRLPGPVFVRGFVRNYARLLEMDAEALINTVELPKVPSPASSAVPLSRNIPFPEKGRTNWVPYALVLLLVAGAVVIFEVFFSSPPVVVVSAVAPKPEDAPVMAQVPPPVGEAVSASPQPPPQLEVITVAGAPEAVAEPLPSPSSSPAPVLQAGMADLHFVFETDSWVEVRDRNERILFSQLNPVGSEHRMQGRRPLSLVIGNARGVRLKYNGQLFDLTPHTRVEVARFTLE